MEQWSYQDGSIGGAPFFMKRHSHKGKHRVAVHKYPESNRVDYVRQGRDVFDFVISAYVIGGVGDIPYDIARKKLWDVLRKGGQVSMIHPYLGAMLVHIRSFSMNENSSTGNIAQFRFTVSQVSPQSNGTRVATTGVGASIANIPPLSTGEAQALQTIIADEVIAAAEVKAAVQNDPSSWVDGVIDSKVFNALQIPSEAIKKLGDYIEQAIAFIADVQQIAHQLMAAKRQVARVKRLIGTMVVDTALLYDSILRLIVPGMGSTGPRIGDSFSRFGELIRLSNAEAETAIYDLKRRIGGVFGHEDGEDSSDGTPNPTINIPIQIVATVARIELVSHIMTMTFDTETQISDVEDSTVRLLNNELQKEGISTTERQVLIRLKTATIAHLTRQRNRIGGIAEVAPAYNTNAILITYGEVASVQGTDRVVALNNIENPMFVEQGTLIVVGG